MQKASFEIWSPQLRNRRYVDVYLPDSYQTGRRRYPVVYMQDGQNLSDPAVAYGGQTWHLHEGLDWLAGRGIEPIVVGIHNTPGRLAEYSPTRDARHGGGDGDKYARFLIDTLKPRIDAAYRTRRERDATVVAGSSMGGLVSLYLFFRRPSPFGRAAVMSPSIWFAGRSILEFVDRARDTRGRLYLDVGTAEGAGTLRNGRALNRLLRAKGYRKDRLRYGEADGHQHREADWAWRLPQALEFLLRES
ncbi:MAG TPA: alpha/beta hydrolase-fold protein [Vicinamibacterales bacterium]|jgi:predicted alpha/beta superfamily hydrolase